MEDSIRQGMHRTPHHTWLLVNAWFLLVMNMLLCTPRWTGTGATREPQTRCSEHQNPSDWEKLRKASWERQHL